MKTVILLFIILAVLSACGSKTTEYYKAHPEEMKAKLEQCSRMSTAEIMADKECTAANNAHTDKFFGDHIERPLQGKGNGQGFKKF